nr:hypothetical protein CFP56_48627 [Quercus suber]
MELSNKKDYFMHKHERHFLQNIETSTEAKTELSSFSFRILKLDTDLVVGGSATIAGDVAANHRLAASKISYTLE